MRWVLSSADSVGVGVAAAVAVDAAAAVDGDRNPMNPFPSPRCQLAPLLSHQWIALEILPGRDGDDGGGGRGSSGRGDKSYP